MAHPSHPARFSARFGRILVTATMATALAAATAPMAAAAQATPAMAPATTSATDLAVSLTASGLLKLPGAHYYVKVTNNGPDALANATVTVTLDPRAHFVLGACTFDYLTDTATCPFTGVASGASATVTLTAFYSDLVPFTTLNATATRTASTPPDPQPGNDTDNAVCYWRRAPGGAIPSYEMVCPA